MIVTLENTKEWLRVESTDEDALIESLIAAAEDVVEGILRLSLNEYGESIPEEIRIAVYYAVSKLYEERNDLDIEQMTEVLKGLLFAQRRTDF